MMNNRGNNLLQVKVHGNDLLQAKVYGERVYGNDLLHAKVHGERVQGTDLLQLKIHGEQVHENILVCSELKCFGKTSFKTVYFENEHSEYTFWIVCRIQM